jgi:hypothetical protein
MPSSCALPVVLLVALGGCTGVLSGGGPLSNLPGDGSTPRVDGSIAKGSDSTPAPTSDAGPGPQPDGHVTPPAPDTGAPAGIWKPKPGTSWHWQLVGTVDKSVDAKMFDIDLFDNTAANIASLKAKGKVVICYFSAGSYEDWRPDADDFPDSALGSKMDGWNEQWLDIRSQGVRSVMAKRLDLAKSKGCDGVEPDNVDGFENNTGFSLKASDQIAYNTFLAQEAHKRGLSVGLKNNPSQAQQLEPHFDWALNEECLQYNECSKLSAFINAGKAVFHVEYTPASKSSVCPKVQPLSFDSQIKKLDLDAWRDPCWS